MFNFRNIRQKIQLSDGHENVQHAFEDELFFSLRQQRNTWAKVAVGAMAISLLSVLSILVMLPLSEIKPYVVMVDKTTGEAEKLVQVRPASLAERDAVRQAELVSYIVDRETFDRSDNKIRIPDVMERSKDNAAETLARLWTSSSSQYPPKVYGDDVRVRVIVKSISITDSATRDGPDLARVRIVKFREEKGMQTVTRPFVVTIGFNFEPKEDARLESVWKNPLGFIVSSYRIDAESSK